MNQISVEDMIDVFKNGNDIFMWAQKRRIRFDELETILFTMLEEAICDQEDWKVEVSVFFLFHINPIPDRFFPILRKVLLEKWHHSHEDIVSLLELTASTENIETVFETCFLECSYLKSYGREVFVKKCVWALAKYDTQQAWEKIRMLESCSDDLVREATKRVLREMGKTQKKTRERFFCFG